MKLLKENYTAGRCQPPRLPLGAASDGTDLIPGEEKLV